MEAYNPLFDGEKCDIDPENTLNWREDD